MRARLREYLRAFPVAVVLSLCAAPVAAQSGAGTALDLDGLDDVIDTGIIWEPPTDPITVEMWVNLPDPAGGSIFGQTGDTGLTWDGFFLSRGTDHVELWTHGGTGHVAIFDGHPTDRWTHLVIQVRDDPFLKRIYFDLVAGIDGLREGTPTSFLSFLIGARNSPAGVSDFARMAVDEVRIWNRILTEDELREKMYRRLDPAQEPGLIAYYRLDEGVGTTAFDAAWTSDGVISGDPIWSASTAPIGDRSHVGFDGESLAANAEVAVDLFWDNAPGSGVLFSAIEIDGEPDLTTGLPGGIPSKYWHLWVANDAGSYQADALFHFDGLFPGIAETELRLFTRTEAGLPWTEITGFTLDDEGDPGDGNGSLAANDVTEFGQYIIGRSGGGSSPDAQSTFDSNDEGWTVTPDGTPRPAPQYSSTGGNPGGFIGAADEFTGTYWRYDAPAAFTGDKSSIYGGTLSFDLRVPNSGDANRPGVILTGNGITLGYNIDVPGTDWTRYTVPLSETGWHVGSSLTGVSATEDQMRTVLASLEELQILGEWQSSPDRSELDNVVLSTGTEGGLVVWPGDTNNDESVDQADVLPIGLCWSQSGPTRANASIVWSGQQAGPWQTENCTYADANGDGVVHQADVLPIGLNWNKARGAGKVSGPALAQAPGRAISNTSSLSLELDRKITPGEEFWVDVRAEDVTDLFGISFELLYSPPIEILNVESGSFMGDDLVFHQHTEGASGKVGIGISRKGGQGGVDGSGVVARFRMRASGAAAATIFLKHVIANGSSGRGMDFQVPVDELITSIDDRSSLPSIFDLHPSYPNPFNPATRFQYDLPEEAHVVIEIVNVLGQRIVTLVDELKSPGRYAAVWSGRDDGGRAVSSGVYLLRMKAGGREGSDFVEVIKMSLLK